MGYTTDFDGQFTLDRPLEVKHKNYLEAFSNSRRMKRDSELVKDLPDPVRELSGLPCLPEYYVGGAKENHGQTRTADIIEYNYPPDGQPGLWCQWVPTEDGTGIKWDGGEKFYEYVEWLKYIIEHFLKPWGYVMNGVVSWEGEDSGDTGDIKVTDNEVKVFE